MEPVQLIMGPVAKTAAMLPCRASFWHSAAWPNFSPFDLNLSCTDYQKRTEIFLGKLSEKNGGSQRKDLRRVISLLFHCPKKFVKFFCWKSHSKTGWTMDTAAFSSSHLLRFKPVSSHVCWNVCGLAVFLWTGVKVINFMKPNWSWWPCSAWQVGRKAMRKMYNENRKTLQALRGCGMRTSKWEEAGKVMPTYIFHS